MSADPDVPIMPTANWIVKPMLRTIAVPKQDTLGLAGFRKRPGTVKIVSGGSLKRQLPKEKAINIPVDSLY
jgi:hypothetical protein